MHSNYYWHDAVSAEVSVVLVLDLNARMRTNETSKETCSVPALPLSHTVCVCTAYLVAFGTVPEVVAYPTKQTTRLLSEDYFEWTQQRNIEGKRQAQGRPYMSRSWLRNRFFWFLVV